MYLYIFGSHVRGEFDDLSDVDFLIIKNNEDKNTYDLNKFSVYEISRIKELWEEGNPFAWHLYKESRIVYSDDKENIIESLGTPSPYINMKKDLDKFHNLYLDSVKSLIEVGNSKIFDLAMIFLSIRNFATCYSLGINQINFSRNSAFNLGNKSLEISDSDYDLIKRARILSTRGKGQNIDNNEINNFLLSLDNISMWFINIKNEVK